MATYVLCPLSTFMSVFNNSGLALTNGLIWTYAAGTTTPTNTWTDSTGSVLNSNPIQLTVGGTLNNVNIYQQAGTKIKVQFSTNAGTVGSPVFGVQIGPTFDNVVGVGDTVFGQNTYYGGTDTGSANAYVLNFSATFTSYTNGTIIYWIPSNTNTGASTINVNGLGAINITNADGSALIIGQVLANQVSSIAIQGGAAVLLSSGVSSSAGTGSALFTLTGFSGTVTTTATYYISGQNYSLRFAPVSGTSNATGFAMSSTAGAILPNSGHSQWVTVTALQDNGSPVYMTQALLSFATLPTRTAISFFKGGSATGWTNTGTKGIGDGVNLTTDVVISYRYS